MLEKHRSLQVSFVVIVSFESKQLSKFESYLTVVWKNINKSLMCAYLYCSSSRFKDSNGYSWYVIYDPSIFFKD